MKVLAVLPLVAAYQVLETSNQLDVNGAHTYDGMKATLKGISAMQQKGEIDKDTIDTVTNMISQIESELKGALVQDVTATQKLLDDAEDAIIACDTAKTDFNGDAFVTLNSDVGTADSTHSDCRGEEQIECNNATAHCNTLRTQVCGWNNCIKPKASRFETSDNDDIFDYMCCLETFFKDESENYYDNRLACLEAVNMWVVKSGECDDDQNTYESEFCRRETDVESACETYRTCRNTEQAAYTGIKEQVQSLEEIYRAQRVALECLICYGEHILDNSTDLAECETPPACTDLTDCPTIVYDKLPACIPCTEPNLRVPCTEDFLGDQYAKYENTCTPPSQCNSCVGRDGTFTQDEGEKTCDDVAPTSFDEAAAASPPGKVAAR